MKRILIIQTAFIGDVILITPLIRSTKELYPQAEIDVLTLPSTASLLQNNPHVNRVYCYNKRQKGSFFKILRTLRERRYDMAISPHSSTRSHLLMYLAGVPHRLGFDRGAARILLTAKIKHPRGIHKSQKNLALLSLISKREFSHQTELFPSSRDIEAVRNMLVPLRGKRLIVLAPGSVWGTKCWPIEYYSQICVMLDELGFGLILSGSPAEKDKCDQILEACPSALSLCGKTDLLESAAAIAEAELIICNDSGALHIANAMKTPVVAFFGPTVLSIGYYPFREGDYVFETQLECRPCGSHGPQVCPKKHHDCMRMIKPETVIEYLKKRIL